MVPQKSQAGLVDQTSLRWDMIGATTHNTDGTMLKVFLYLALTAVFCLAATGSVFGQTKQMYRWTDENGVVHFTDTRPEGQNVTVYDIPESGQQVDHSPAGQADTAGEPSLAQQRREEMASKREEAQAAQAVNDAECAAKRSEVEQLEPHRRVFFTNEQGETERMDDVERTNRVAEAKAFIEKNCK
jgi:hypothetical protein